MHIYEVAPGKMEEPQEDHEQEEVEQEEMNREKKGQSGDQYALLHGCTAAHLFGFYTRALCYRVVVVVGSSSSSRLVVVVVVAVVVVVVVVSS